MGPAPVVALSLLLAAFLAGPLMGAVAGFSPSRDDIALRHFYQRAATDLARALWGGLWLVAQLLQRSISAVDAIVRALYRTVVSRRHLLQWTTAAAAQARARTQLPALIRQHASEPLLALALLAALFALDTPHPWMATGLCLLWGASPLWTWWVSRPRPASAEAALGEDDKAYFEGVARDTWRLFERCVVAEDHYLPPDNLQTVPADQVAHRTSPTNIGLYLLSTACARQFGWIGTSELLSRLEATLGTLDQLQRYRGHFLNWYDTRTQAPLLPMYVSTVDSGNLSGHLLAVAQACRERAAAESADRSTDDAGARLLAVAGRCERLAWEADFGFLYHPKRHLLHIGYRVAEHQLDAGFYDLLASESRLTSLLAIAKGDVPVRHWSSLGRLFYAAGADAGLRSWSGSMFEYLMPTLVLDEPAGSVLHEACHAALREQMAFAAAQRVQGHAVPWGISESAYAGRDHTLAYQYAPQGVPRLALRRTPPDELVIAPYATALAAQIAPHLARQNFAALEARAAREALGFIEALDFTAARQNGDEPYTRVSTFMAHHQGMTIVALANVLLGGVAQRWGMANPHLEAVSSLLHERAPREVSGLFAPPAGPPPLALQRRAPGLLREVVPGATALEPTQVLSNGRYSVTLRANGAGWSRWRTAGITRWRDDALRDTHGSFFYLRWPDEDRPSALPAGTRAVCARSRSTRHRIQVCPLPQRLPRRSGVLRRRLAAGAGAHHGVGQPGGRHRVPTGRVAQPGRPAARARADLRLRRDAGRAARRRGPPGVQQPVREGALACRGTHAAVRAQSRAWSPNRACRRRTFSPRAIRRCWRFGCRPTGNAGSAATAPPPSRRPRSTRRRRSKAPKQAAAQRLDTGLDPVCAMAVRLRIAPQGTAQLTFATAASPDGGTLRAVIDKHRQPSHVKRASLMSATLAGIRFRTLRLSAENFAAIQMLTTALVSTLSRAPDRPARPGDAAPVCDRRLLWRFGLSGDRPIVLVAVSAPEGLGLIRSLAQALRLWSWGGIACDLVVINAEPSSYLMTVQRELGTLRDRHAADSGAEFQPAGLPGPTSTGFHVLRSDELSADENSTLHRLAQLRLQADGRPLAHHVQEWTAWHEQAFEERHAVSTAAATVAVRPLGDPPVGQFVAAEPVRSASTWPRTGGRCGLGST